MRINIGRRMVLKNINPSRIIILSLLYSCLNYYTLFAILVLDMTFSFKHTFLLGSFLVGFPALVHAQSEPLKARTEVNIRSGNERGILMTEFWVPIAQNPVDGSVIYGDLRMMGDDQSNREFNLGVGYREIMPHLNGVVGGHAWFDRRQTERGSDFNQITIGGEYLGKTYDVLVNGYIPLSGERVVTVANPNAQGPALAGTGIVVDTASTVLEEPQHGFDIEFGWQIPYLQNQTDSTRLYAGGYYFNGSNTEDVAGVRARIASDITQNIQIGARLQRDDERGSQGFLEATIRFPFDNKKSYRKEGLRARLDDSPERDIDIVTGDNILDAGNRVAVLNQETGTAQEVLHVDNTAAGGGDGSAENPFNTLAAAQAASSAHTIIYVNQGDGTTTGQDAGILLNQTGQSLIGSGVNFVYDGTQFTTANGMAPTSRLIRAAGTAPVITNTGGLGVNISGDDVEVAGITVDGSLQANLEILNANNVYIHDVTSTNAGVNGINTYFDGNDTYTFLIDNVTVDGSGGAGIFSRALNNTTMTGTVQNSLIDNSSGNGLSTQSRSASTSDITYDNNVVSRSNVNFRYEIFESAQGNVTMTNNTADASTTFMNVLVRAGGNATLNNVTITDNIVKNSNMQGIQIDLFINGITSSVLNGLISGNTVTDNGNEGIALRGHAGNGNIAVDINDNTVTGNASGFLVEANDDTSVTSSLSGNVVTGNTNNGVRINDDSTGTIVADFGGGMFGSVGQNSVFGNGYQELRVDLDGANLDAQNNWWGSVTGLAGGELTLDDASTADTSNFLTFAP
jgi:hypothetical protein